MERTEEAQVGEEEIQVGVEEVQAGIEEVRAGADQLPGQNGLRGQVAGSDLAVHTHVMCDQIGVTQRVGEEEEGMEFESD